MPNKVIKAIVAINLSRIYFNPHFLWSLKFLFWDKSFHAIKAIKYFLQDFYHSWRKYAVGLE